MLSINKATPVTRYLVSLAAFTATLWTTSPLLLRKSASPHLRYHYPALFLTSAERLDRFLLKIHHVVLDVFDCPADSTCLAAYRRFGDLRKHVKAKHPDWTKFELNQEQSSFLLLTRRKDAMLAETLEGLAELFPVAAAKQEIRENQAVAIRAELSNGSSLL